MSYTDDMKPCRECRHEGLVSISQFTVGVYALAQFAFAYSLIAQLGIYIHEGHRQLVKSLSELIGMR